MPELGKERRVCGRIAVEQLFREGRGGFAHPLRYLLVTQTDKPGVAVLVGVPKKLHKRAVMRNFLKRRIREAFRLQSAELHAQAVERGIGIRLALLYATKDMADYKTISDAVERILSKIEERF